MSFVLLASACACMCVCSATKPPRLQSAGGGTKTLTLNPKWLSLGTRASPERRFRLGMPLATVGA